MRMFSFRLIFCVLLLSVFSAVHAENKTVYGPVKKGEILWRIAGKLRPNKSISHQQMILALLKANPQAFERPCNLNSMKTGSLLRIPSLTRIQRLSRKQAVTEFARQEQAWSKRQQKPIICPQTTPADTPKPVTSISDKATSKANTITSPDSPAVSSSVLPSMFQLAPAISHLPRDVPAIQQANAPTSDINTRPGGVKAAPKVNTITSPDSPAVSSSVLPTMFQLAPAISHLPRDVPAIQQANAPTSDIKARPGGTLDPVINKPIPEIPGSAAIKPIAPVAPAPVVPAPEKPLTMTYEDLYRWLLIVIALLGLLTLLVRHLSRKTAVPATSNPAPAVPPAPEIIEVMETELETKAWATKQAKITPEKKNNKTKQANANRQKQKAVKLQKPDNNETQLTIPKTLWIAEDFAELSPENSLDEKGFDDIFK
ncbi:FimV/HubP family polar landmark protein [Candidatus Venteria ishoeyi]|uniref:FimV/HubP family polar landmark protein n=1 Tax=Candidatus Venteria ishoeyi TaxID=1899563 RepID=UPI0025A4E20B|nr:FimV/HubP family polar landmark protein [Candidatus Venteria ishoeyi]MDM8548280.1 FimV/HubP family polar landmark protein [Candidatus Venteria ishoeyi]